MKGKVQIEHNGDSRLPQEGNMFVNCGMCLKELPKGESPASYAKQQVSWTEDGFQVWCGRHEVNIDKVTLSVKN